MVALHESPGASPETSQPPSPTRTSPTPSSPTGTSPTPSSPSPEESSLSKKMAGMSVSPIASSPLSRASSFAQNRTHDPTTKGQTSANGSPKAQNTGLDPRSVSFQPTNRPQGAASVTNTQPQAPSSVSGPTDSPFPTSNSVLNTPASQRTFTASTPSSTAWGSSPNTQYSSGGSGALRRSAVSTRLSEPDVLGLRRLSSVLDRISQPFEPTPDTATHWLLLTDVPNTANQSQLEQLLNKLGDSKAILCHHLKACGWVVIAFWDSREAYKVYKDLSRRTVRFTADVDAQQLHCVFISEAEARELTGNVNEWDYLWSESERAVRIQVLSPLGVEAEGFKAQLSKLGDLKRFQTHDNTGHVFTAEFYDSRAAADAIRTFNDLPITGGTFFVSYLSEDPFLAEPSRNTTFNFPDYNARSLLTESASTFALSPGRASTAASSPTSLTFSRGRVSAPWPGYSSQGLPSPLNTSPPAITGDLNLRVDSLFQFQPLDTSSPSFPRTQSNTIPRRRSQLDVRAAPTHPWSTPAIEELHNAATQELYNATRPNRPPNLRRRATDSATLQSLLNGINETAQALQRQGPASAPLSPTSLTPRSYSGWGQSDSKAVPVENIVFPERIAAGLDNRTTVMVKDVPNKLSRQELVDILNQVVPGEFDFVYLRFDFNNHCNVGYAFVNFTSTRALLNFYRARVGKRWNLFSSEKVLQVGYANIQGKVALVNKFRNSAVMEVHEEWRPQIFYSDGALRGRPEPFPESDSTSRGQRAASSARLSFLQGPSPDMGDYDYSNRPHEFGL